MIQVIAKLLICVAVTQWLYAEMILFYPESESLAKRFFQKSIIPTHDQWPDSVNSRIKQDLCLVFAKIFYEDSKDKPASAMCNEEPQEKSSMKSKKQAMLNAPAPVQEKQEKIVIVGLFAKGEKHRRAVQFLSGQDIFGSEFYKTRYFRARI